MDRPRLLRKKTAHFCCLAATLELIQGSSKLVRTREKTYTFLFSLKESGWIKF